MCLDHVYWSIISTYVKIMCINLQIFVHVYQSKYMFLDPVYQSITYV